MKKFKAFTHFYPNQRFLERFTHLIEEHAFYHQQLNKMILNKVEIKIHIQRIEEELLFLISLLKQDEYQELLKNGFKITWLNSLEV
ncbi:hypothetical protein ACT7C7_29640 [Bacillus cereus]